MKIDEKKFYDIVCENGFYTTPKRLKFFFSNQLSPGVDFVGKSVIDIGGGNGLFGFFALIRGAREVVIMEPEFEGSTNGMIKQFYELYDLMDRPEEIRLVKETIQEFNVDSHEFDIIFMANSINHFDENACIDLHKNQSSKDIYRKIFARISRLSNKKARIVLTDCTNKNFFPSIGMTNPFMPSIAWQKHQPPEIWASFLAELGFVVKSTRWSSPNSLGWFGRAFLGNKIANYFTLGHFRLEMERI